MSYIAAVLYIVLQDEYEAFLVLCHVMQHKNIR